MKLIYAILFLSIVGTYGQFNERMNWTFAELPSETDSQKRYKCARKLDFSCECKTASSTYDVGSSEEIHPFCLTDEGKVHGACTGGCLDVHMRNIINTQVDGVVISIEQECTSIQRTWTPPVYPLCLNEKGENVYGLNGGGSCDTLAKCINYDVCQKAGSCADSNPSDDIDDSCQNPAAWDQNGVPSDETHIAGICEMAGEASGSTLDVTSSYDTEEECKSPLTFVAPMNKVTKYYEINKVTESNGVLNFEENEHRQCIAGEETKTRYGIDECPINDPFCQQFQKVDKIDIDSDNYNQMILSSSFTKIGKIRRCDSRGKYDSSAGKWDNQLYPLAPCPDDDAPYYCDYPQNELFGSGIDTTCGVGLYDNKTRNNVGLPHGIREFENGYDMESFQWSVEQEDSVSLATNMNAILTEMETVQMNIYTIGKLIDRKFILESQREGLDEQHVNEDNAMELNKFFERLALSGDQVAFSELQTEEEVKAAAEWSPTDLHATGHTSQLRCHTVDDSTVSKFRAIKDVRTDFVEQFFAANKEQDCNLGDAILDNETRFSRCANDEQAESFLYPSSRKAFFNPIKADFFLSGFMKGQRFVKEMAKSKEEIGFVNAGMRQMVDGTNVPQNATYNHIKFMLSMSTDQVENCNTVTGKCRPTWHQYANYRFKVKTIGADSAVLEDHVESSSDINATSFAFCKVRCFNNADCGGFMYKATAGLHQCKLLAAVGKTESNNDYDDIRNTLLQDDLADDWTAVALERPDCEYRILNTRYVDIEVKDDGTMVDRQSHADDISGFWGYGETIDKGRQWGYQTCRTSITVKKLEKIDADQVDLGLKNTAGQTFIDGYPYTITIEDEGCQNQVIEKKETVSQATSAAVSLTEAEEIVKIHAAATPTWCRSRNGHYSGVEISSELGGVCLSHKEEQRHEFPNADKPFGSTTEQDAKCYNGDGVNQINLYPTKKDCYAQGFTWEESRSFLHRGRAETCFVNGAYALHVHETKEDCEAQAGGVWTDAVPATDALGFIKANDYKLIGKQCMHVVPNKATCDGDAEAEWNEKLQQCFYPFVISQFDCASSNPRISATVKWDTFYTADTVPISYEDERLTCGPQGYGAKHVNGPYTSKYDRIRMVMFVDVLRLKDLYEEGKGASSIVPRGLPVGLTEGFTPVNGFKDPLTEVKHVGQHRLTVEDQDVVYYNPDTKQSCTVKEAADPSTGCLVYSYASGYRASGRGETFRGRTQQERDDRNQIRKVVGEYLVRDVGVDEASESFLGQPFWEDDLTTISFLGTATSSDVPLELAVQDIREDFGDAKIYNRYMVELFSKCHDRTQQQQHSSRLHIQIFKEGRLHGDRIRDSLPEILAGDYNQGFTQYDIASSSANGEIVLPSNIGQPLNSKDLVTLHGASCPQAGNYMLKTAGFMEDFSVAQVIVPVATTNHVCADMPDPLVSSSQVDAAACAQVASDSGKLSFSFDSDSGTCIVCESVDGATVTTPVSTHYTFTTTEQKTYLGTYTYKATVVAYPSKRRAMGAPITATIDAANCKISLMERQCDGFSYDATTEQLLSEASPVHQDFQITTKDVCGPVEMDQSNCPADASQWADAGTCSDATKLNQYDCETSGNQWQQLCLYLRPCGSDTPLGFAKTCTTPSNSRCQICNADTPTCYDTTRGSLHADGALPARAMSIDMKCAGFDFTNPDIKLGMTVKKVIDTLPDDIDNLDFYNLPVENQKYGNIYGAELVEFSVGFNLLDTIAFDTEQYLELEGMGNARTEVIAFLKNNRIGEIEQVKDVRSMGDLTYPQLTTEEVIFTVQSYDPNFDPELHNVHIETVNICSHQPASFFEPYISLGKIERNVVNCLIGKQNDGRDGYGNILLDSKYAAGTDPCQYVFETCPHKPMTGFSLRKQETNYFLLADYRPLYGQEGHLFIDDTCDMLSITRLMDLLSLPDFGNEFDNNMVYQFANNLPEKCTTTDGVTTCVNSGDEAVKQACIQPSGDSDLQPEDFFKKIGPKDDQTPVSQTIVRNFKSMMMKEAKDLERGIREVVPCRRLQTHGDDLSPEFAETILHGYTKGYGSLSEFGDRFEPRNCWHDSFETVCTNTTGHDVTSIFDTGAKCRMPSMLNKVATVSLTPNKCNDFELGYFTPTNSQQNILLVPNFFNRYEGQTTFTKEQCQQLCEDNKVSHCVWTEGGALVAPKGDCYYVGGTNPAIEVNDQSTFYVTACAEDTEQVKSSATGMFKENVKALSLSAVSTVSEAKRVCDESSTCIGFHESPKMPENLYCSSPTPFSGTISIQDATANPDVVKSVDECMFQCASVTLGGVTSTSVEYVQDDKCVCKVVSGADCQVGEVAGYVSVLNHYEIDVTFDVNAGGQPENIVVNRGKDFTFFETIDSDLIDTTSVTALSSTYYIRLVGDGCSWCTWDNTKPKTYDDDSESCMTNVLSHLSNAQSFEDYLDNIGPALDMQQEICVQKNNIYRQPGTKHIPCGYNNLYNFDLESVYAPEQFELTAEEIDYRLNPKAPSWDAIIFHPDDVGDLANHYEPITKNFILPIKAEIIIQGHGCYDDYDFAAAPGGSRRRRMLGNRVRKRVGRKLLQADGEQPGQFGATSNIAFTIAINLETSSTAVTNEPVQINGRLVYPGDPDYPLSQSLASVDRSFTAKPLLDASDTENLERVKQCVDNEETLLVTLVYATYYGVILLWSVAAAVAGTKQFNIY
jgi:hypothetical protein